MTIPEWAAGLLVVVMLAVVSALVQLSFFLGGVLKRLDAYQTDIIDLRRSRHEHSQAITQHEARITFLEESRH